MLKKVRLLLEMIRFSHTLFALPFAMLAAVMAWATPSASGESAKFEWLQLLGVLLCMVGARSAGMAFNRLVDRHIDAENPRTAARHLPAGQLTVGAVSFFIAASLGLFFLGTLCFLPNWLPLALAIPVLAIVFGYSYTKRFTSLAHFWLGAALSLAPLAAWIAIRGEFVLEQPTDLWPPLVVSLAVMFWVAGFDIVYACQDQAFDVQADLKSVPSRLGTKNALRVAAACHAVMIGLLLFLPYSHWLGGPAIDLGWIYYVGLLPIIVLLIYEHLLVSHDDLTKVNVAFFNINAVVSIGLFLLVSLDLWV